jgi:hypothetical protein
MSCIDSTFFGFNGKNLLLNFKSIFWGWGEILKGFIYVLSNLLVTDC